MPLSFKLRKKPAVSGVSGDGAQGAEPMLEMSFLDHLEELRWRIIKGLVGVLVGAVVCMFFWEWVIDVLLLGPTRADFFMYEVLRLNLEEFIIQNRTVPGQFFVMIGTVGVVGVIIGAPVLIYQLWAFIEPGLYPHEKSKMRFTAVWASFFFALGVSFGYLILTPVALSFFAGLSLSSQIINEFDVTNYFSMVTMWALGAGLLFELPVVVYLLSKIGLLNPAILRKSRRFALIIILVIAAFLTPPDPMSQIIMAIPLLLLYQGSIWISGVAVRRRAKEMKEALGE
ncbi:MAG: twin-arginine translocase subunit TatC [Bacteroidota bacterium]